MGVYEELQGIWVLCGIRDGRIDRVSRELLGEAERLGTAGGMKTTAVVLGREIPQIRGADHALMVQDDSLSVPEELRWTHELYHLVRRYRPQVLLLGANGFGRSLAPRLAARLSTGLTADCTALDMRDGLLVQTRPAFGGNLMADILCPAARPQMATVRPRVFRVPDWEAARPCEILRVSPAGPDALSRLVEITGFTPSGQDAAIGEADILVAVGQGIGSKENIALAEKLAELMGGALAASRPLVDGGMVPYAHQVGQTGRTVAPRLYIACGISGAIQHLAGVAAEKIVAVNIDPDAPIMERANWAILGDCGAFLREMVDLYTTSPSLTLPVRHSK